MEYKKGDIVEIINWPYEISKNEMVGQRYEVVSPTHNFDKEKANRYKKEELDRMITVAGNYGDLILYKSQVRLYHRDKIGVFLDKNFKLSVPTRVGLILAFIFILIVIANQVCTGQNIAFMDRVQIVDTLRPEKIIWDGSYYDSGEFMISEGSTLVIATPTNRYKVKTRGIGWFICYDEGYRLKWLKNGRYHYQYPEEIYSFKKLTR